MRRACEAKFTQNDEAREALVSTTGLSEFIRRDSKTISYVIRADVWMRIRDRLRKEVE